MNILVTLDKGYLKPLCVMLRSLTASNPCTDFDIYVLNKGLCPDDFDYINRNVAEGSFKLHDIKIDDGMLKDAPVTDRYPKEMYYRIFAARFLPDNVDKILYLDPDLVVLKPLQKLYDINIENYCFAAASHVSKPLQKFNELRLQMDSSGPYINSGVMLMNLEKLRREQDFCEVFEYIDKNKRLLFLPDQDIISAIYSDKILLIDPYIYNMTERMLYHPKSIKNNIDFCWVEQNSAIIHYCGRNKPWKDNYNGCLDSIYHRFSQGIYSQDNMV